MSYKVKSLVYFVCFLTAAFTYYITDNEIQLDNDADKEVVELKIQRD